MMEKAEKNRLRNSNRQQQRKAAFDLLPLSVGELKAMFDMLDVELPRQGCDHTRRLTETWLDHRGHDVGRVFAWFDTVGGFCDCEVLANVEQHVAAASKGGA
jgi:hypothetical protein